MYVHRCFYILLCLLLWSRLSILTSSSTTEGTCSSELGAESTPESGQQYIVRFREYQRAAHWRRALEEVLGDVEPQWEWVERHNAAASFPTDFGVVRFQTDAAETVQVDLNRALGELGGRSESHRDACSSSLSSETSTQTACCIGV